MEKSCTLTIQPETAHSFPDGVNVLPPQSGIFHGFDAKNLLKYCEEKDIVISFLHPINTFVLKHTPFAIVSNLKDTGSFEEKIKMMISFRQREIIHHYYYGFRQITEVGIKALSPGINDPGTAILSLHVLADLLAYRIRYFPDDVIRDENGKVRIVVKEKSFEEMFSEYILPIWDYGKNDRLLQEAMYKVLLQLQMLSPSSVIQRLLKDVQYTITHRE